MRTTARLLALALTVSTGALWAQDQTTPAQPVPIADEGTATSSTPPADTAQPVESAPPATASPTNQESDALPQSGTLESTESTVPSPIAAEPPAETAAPVEKPQAEPAPSVKLEVANGTVVSTSSSALELASASGAKLSFVLDATTTRPDLRAKDAVSVEYVTMPDGSRRASRVTLATPKRAAVAATKKAPAKPLAPVTPVKSIAVTPAAPLPTTAAVTEPAPAAAALTSGTTSGTTSAASATTAAAAAEEHTLSSSADSQAVNPSAPVTVEPSSPTHMMVPIALLLGGLLFITVLGVRQARREA